MKIKQILVCSALLALPVMANSGSYTAQMKNACPGGWEETSSILPIVLSDTQIPWRKLEPPVSDTGFSRSLLIAPLGIDPADINAVYNSLTPAAIIATISPATQQDLAGDPLTIASNCLLYRNFELDTATYVAPRAVAENLKTGWIPAAIF